MLDIVHVPNLHVHEYLALQNSSLIVYEYKIAHDNFLNG